MGSGLGEGVQGWIPLHVGVVDLLLGLDLLPPSGLTTLIRFLLVRLAIPPSARSPLSGQDPLCSLVDP